jgi:hypothetical protein
MASLADLPLSLHGSPVCMVVSETPEPTGPSLLAMLRSECAKRGVLLEPNAIYPSAAMTPEVLARSVEALTEACSAVRQRAGGAERTRG